MIQRVRLFAAVAEQLASREIEIELAEDATAADLLLALGEQFPAAANLLRKCRVAVDQKFVDSASALAGATEVALIPPVSGG